jgi:hypothetical protein
MPDADTYPDIANDDPNDNSADTPVSLPSISSKSGAGAGDNALSISLNLSTAVPIGVVDVKSVNNPSVYVPSSASPIAVDPFETGESLLRDFL